MSDWPTVTAGNAWAPAQGRFLSAYRTRKAELPHQRMWVRVWPAEAPRRRWWSADPMWDFRQLLRIGRGVAHVRGRIALYPVGAEPGTPPVLVVVTGEEQLLDPDDMMAVDVYGTVAPSGHFVIDAGGWGELTPDSNPELPGPHAPVA